MSDELDWSGLETVLRHHFKTGEYGDCRLAMCRELWLSMRDHFLPKDMSRTVQPWEFNATQLMSIPVVIDDNVPADYWELRRTVTVGKVKR